MAVAALLLTGCGDGGGTSGKRMPQAGDTLYTEERAMAIYDSLPGQALAILDSAEAVGNMTDYRAALFRAIVLSKSTAMQNQDSAIIICEGLLRHDEARRNVDFRQDVLELLVNASRTRQDYAEMVHWTTELVQLLRGQGLTTEALRTDADLGLAMAHLGLTEEGLAKIDDVIRQLGNTKKFNELDAWLIAAKRKIYVLQKLKVRHDEVIALADQMQWRLDHFAAHPDDYHDGTYREPDKADIPGYHDFYCAQACAYKAAAHAFSGDLAAARSEIDTFRQYPYSHTLDGRMLIAETLGRLGDWEAMLATYDDFERDMMSEGDTLNGACVEILRGRAEAASASGHAARAYDYLKRYDALKSRLSDDLQRSKAHLYVVRYQTLELESTLHRERAVHVKNFFVNIFIGMALFVVATAVVYLYRQQRLLNEKNRILVKKLVGTQEDKRLYYSLKAQKDSGSAKTGGGTTELVRLEAMDDVELFDYISDVIRRERLFLNPVCDRQTLVDLFHISEKRLGAAFSKGSSYRSVASFVRDVRLEYACQLLRNSPDMPIADIAAASGFPSYTRFASDFKAAYSISPTEFRLQSQQ